MYSIINSGMLKVQFQMHENRNKHLQYNMLYKIRYNNSFFVL